MANVCVLCWNLFPFLLKKIKSDFVFMRSVVEDIQGTVRCMAVNCPKLKWMFLFSLLFI